MPLTFTSVTDETNFWCLLALLNFGSGYRVPLHDLCRRVYRTNELHISNLIGIQGGLRYHPARSVQHASIRVSYPLNDFLHLYSYGYRVARP